MDLNSGGTGSLFWERAHTRLSYWLVTSTMYNVILNWKRHIRTFPSTTSWPPLHCTYTPHLHIRKCIYTYTHLHTYVYIHIRAVLLLLLTCTMYNLHYFWAADAHSSSATMHNSMSHFFSFSQIVFSSKHLDSSISQSHLILHQRQLWKDNAPKSWKHFLIILKIMQSCNPWLMLFIIRQLP